MKVFFSVVLTLLVSIQVYSIKISNTQPRIDIDGNLMDIHDGSIFQSPIDGSFYFYGMGYGSCINPSLGCLGAFGLNDCGFQFNHSVNLYVSKDLINWTFKGNVFPESQRPDGVYFRVKVLHDVQRIKGGMFWVDTIPNYFDASLLVAVSDTPEGPFTVVTEQVNTLRGNPGDFTVFIDDDLKGYLVYDNMNTNHRVIVEQLTDDYLDVNQQGGSILVSGMNNEAPIFFKRNDWYYLLFGKCCCFCHEGSNSKVLISKNPMGPYTDPQIDIDPFIGSFLNKRSISGGQESFVFQIKGNGAREDSFIFVSDRWASALDGQKGHDLQYWGKLEFYEEQGIPLIKTLQWEDEWSLEI